MVDPDELDPSGELKSRLEERAREYGTYVATSRIFAGNAPAYDVGHPIPVSNVVRHGYFLNGQCELVDGMEHPPEVAAQAEVKANLAAGGDPAGEAARAAQRLAEARALVKAADEEEAARAASPDTATAPDVAPEALESTEDETEGDK